MCTTGDAECASGGTARCRVSALVSGARRCHRRSSLPCVTPCHVGAWHAAATLHLSHRVYPASFGSQATVDAAIVQTGAGVVAGEQEELLWSEFFREVCIPD